MNTLSSALPVPLRTVVRFFRLAPLLALSLATVCAAVFHVAPDGDDSQPGTLAAPFASLARAQEAATTGDTVYLHGGIYTRFAIAESDKTYDYVHVLAKDGVRYLAVPGELPVFDFSAIPADPRRICAFLVTGSDIVLEGFHVTGIQVGRQRQSEAFRINSGRGNILRRLVIRDCSAIGVYIQRTASHTLVENCDAYNLVGVRGVSAGNIDGFGAHSAGEGNIFRGCRAWNCSDDGFDVIHSPAAVTFENCWSYANGSNGGDGNGFKVGGWANRPQNTLPDPLPVHTVTGCLAVENHANGFYANHHPGQAATWTRNTAFGNARANFNLLTRPAPDYSSSAPQTRADSGPGGREVLVRNLAHRGVPVANLDEIRATVSDNSWQRPTPPIDEDFLSVDPGELVLPRRADGSLPEIRFMRPKPGSSFSGLGCF